jgi:ATP-dependent DNA helicase RecQ
MNVTTDFLKQSLKQHFGYDSFRNGQEEVIQSVLNGNDSLVVMPTGGGKSLCFQLPALLVEGTVLVVSPLIALMKDQVDALMRAGIPSTFINSSITFDENSRRLESASRGEYRLMYIAPERLESQRFIDTLASINISLFAVDEAHCISEWGHDFRPAYMNIIKALDKIQRVPIIALTATATPDVQEDIVHSLKMQNIKRFIRGFDRPNLSYKTFHCTDKPSYITKHLKSSVIGSTIIYCGTRKRVEEFADYLNNSGVKALPYHAGMDDSSRKSVQEKFINGKNTVIIATNAFGMGIDKPNVRNVFHCDLTSSLEAYYQEAGRAGRDGEPADCILLYEPSDRRLQEFFIKTSFPPIKDIEQIYETIYDAAQIKLGEKSLKPLALDEYQIAKLAYLPVYEVNSVLSLLEKNKIIKLANNQGSASLHIKVPRDRIVDYFKNTNKENRKVLEAILRSVASEAFYKEVQFDYSSLLIKYNINADDFLNAVQSFIFAGLINFVPAGVPNGITFILERMPFKNVPIDFNAFYRRKKYAIHKLDIVEEYVKTDECKRNFILKYFQEEDIQGSCGKCGSCTSTKTPNKKLDKSQKQEYLHQSILAAAAELNGKFGKRILGYFLKGSKSIKITRFNLQDAEHYACCDEFQTYEIETAIERAIDSGELFRDKENYLTIKITNLGLNKLNIKPQVYKINRSLIESNYDPELYKILSTFRSSISNAVGISESSLLDDKLLQQICREKPVSIADLSEFEGISPILVKSYGNSFIELIKHCISKKNENKIKKFELSETNNTTYQLIQSGLSMVETAEKRNLTIGTIASHLQEAVEAGYDLDRDKFCSNELYDKIKELLKNKPNQRLAEIRELLDSEIGYPLLRVAVALARRELGII